LSLIAGHVIRDPIPQWPVGPTLEMCKYGWC